MHTGQPPSGGGAPNLPRHTFLSPSLALQVKTLLPMHTYMANGTNRPRLLTTTTYMHDIHSYLPIHTYMQYLQYIHCMHLATTYIHTMLTLHAIHTWHTFMLRHEHAYLIRHRHRHAYLLTGHAGLSTDYCCYYYCFCMRLLLSDFHASVFHTSFFHASASTRRANERNERTRLTAYGTNNIDRTN